jgi:hypothetical protein
VVSRLRLSARVFTLGLGALAVAWGGSLLPQFWHQSLLQRTATRIIYNDEFKVEALQPLLPLIEAAEQEAYCQPSILHSAAIIRLRLMESAIATGQRQSIDPARKKLRTTILSSLACAPADPFLWLVLYWIEVSQDGFEPDLLKYLRMSYETGPAEGWVAVKRNRLALAVYNKLPDDLAAKAVREFANLVKSNFTREAVEILAGPGWPIQDILLKSLEDVPERDRANFAKALYVRELDVQVPGIAMPDRRPWR